MKKFAISVIGLLLSYFAISQNIGDTIISNNQANLKLKIMYFHVTHRCNTCTSIEQTVRKTLFENFKSEIEKGIIDLSIIDCELPENEKIAKKYDAYGATLALTPYLSGAELETEDITNWAFQKIHKQEVFISELKEKIHSLIQ